MFFFSPNLPYFYPRPNYKTVQWLFLCYFKFNQFKYDYTNTNLTVRHQSTYNDIRCFQFHVFYVQFQLVEFLGVELAEFLGVRRQSLTVISVHCWLSDSSCSLSCSFCLLSSSFSSFRSEFSDRKRFFSLSFGWFYIY